MLLKSRRASESLALDSESSLLPTSILTTSQYWRQSTPQALRQQIARRIAQQGAKGEVAKIIPNERLEFKTLWNRSLPINQLPYELLVNIFVLLRPEVMIGCYGIPPSREIFQSNFRLMATCRLWRHVVVDTPAFWSIVVPECWNTKWTELCLARSISAPIEVWVPLPANRPRFFPCPPYPPVHRIRRLYFYFAVHRAFRDLADSPSKDWLFRLPFEPEVRVMPALEDLGLIFNNDERPRGNILNDVNLTRRHFPCLRSLTLNGVQAPRDAALYADLHTLSLNACSHSLSIDQFLDALALCTRLKTLRLHETLERFSSDWKQRDPVPCRPLIYLPHLDSLELSQHGSVCTSRFLSHIHVRAPVQLKISTWDDNRIPTPRDADAAVFLLAGGMLPPNHAATLAPLATVTKVAVSTSWNCEWGIGDAWFSVTRPITTPTATTVAAEMSMNVTRADREAGRGWVRELVELLGRAPVRTLVLDNSRNPPDSVEGWAAVFRAFPRLERLSVHASGSPDGVVGMENMFLGLHAASVCETATATGMGAGSPAAVACPHLREVSVDGLATTAVYEAIRTCIVYRGRQGVVLEELELDLTPCWGDLCPVVCRACKIDIRSYTGRLEHRFPDGTEIDLPVVYAFQDSRGRGVCARFKDVLRRLGAKFRRHVKHSQQVPIPGM